MLDRLLAATPLPPEGASVDDLLAAFAAMHEAREAILAEMVAELPDRAILDELTRRDDLWAAALGAALMAVGDARRNLGRLRSYAR